MKKSYIMYAMTVLLLWIPLVGNAQDRIITGTVTSASDQFPLMGATILIKGTSKGTQTDFDGNFSIEAPKGATLIISFVGFATQNILVENQTIINVILQEEFNALDEVVVTGYATQQRNTMATSVSKLDTKVLQSAPRANAATALQGMVAGLRVTQNTGQPGSTPSLTLRGGTSYGGGGSPLILIDGVPGSFYALNSDDIESMEVLKDAASTAIYGARAANGVILVTTKKGKAGRSNITYRQKYTVNNRRKFAEYLGASDYITYHRKAVKNAQVVLGSNAFNNFLVGPQAFGTGNNTTDSPFTTMILSSTNNYLVGQPGWQTMTDPINPNQTLIFQESQMSELFFQNSYANDHSLSFDGGNENGSYYLGLGYLDDKGIVIGSGFKRYSGTFNASYKITENFKVSSNVIYAHSGITPTYLNNDYSVFQRAAGQPPTSRIYNHNPDGSLSNIPNPGTNSSFGNPLYYGDKFVRKNLEQRLTSSVQIDWTFANNFNLMVRGSHFAINNSNEYFAKAYINAGSLITTRNASASHSRILRNQATAVVSYKNTFANKHNLDILLGTEYFKENTFNFSAGTRLSPTDLIETMNAGAEADGVPYSYRDQYAITSGFGQLNYDFDNRILLGLTFRNDGASRLGNNKFDFFPGASLGWNVHNEAFFKESKTANIISNLKPRISYGVNGNIDILSNFGVFGIYGPSATYDTQSGYGNTSLPLLDLKWERSTTLNFGLDLGIFNNKITILADYFNREVKDKLATLPLPLWTGFSGITTNNGTLQNKGLELEITGKIINNDNLKWSLGANFFRIRNYAKKLPDNGVDRNRQGGIEIYDPLTGETKFVGGLQEGQRVGYDIVTVYQHDGVYANQAEVDEHSGRRVTFASNQTLIRPGDSRWVDQNGDNIIDYRDRVVIGRTTPDFMGGFTSDFSYKNFNLFIKTDFATGHLILNKTRQRGLAQVQGNQNWTTELLKTWTPDNTDTSLARFDFTDPQKNYIENGGQNSSTSQLWEKGDYLALREVTLSYTLPNEALKDIVKSLRFYITGSNLAYLFNNYTGNSPENGGLDDGRFPLPRTITLGLNANF